MARFVELGESEVSRAAFSSSQMRVEYESVVVGCVCGAGEEGVGVQYSRDKCGSHSSRESGYTDV
jgi:hypothetical protein